MILGAAVIDVLEHVEAGGGGGHEDDGGGGEFGGGEGLLDGVGEGIGEEEFCAGKIGVEFVAGLAEEDDFFEIFGAGEEFGDGGEVGVVGFVAAAGDEDEPVVGEGAESDLERGGGGAEVVVVEFDAIDFADEFEAVGEASERLKTRNNVGFVFS